ncbi:GIY-YIG nuclease family protein [Escherichia coli]|nr:GIY-YIG nuclease family protein [Escherichia coli]
MTRRLTTEEFIGRAREKHGDKYDYSLVDYKTCKDKVEIICKHCGTHFAQTPDIHLNQKCGCPECRKLKIAQSKTKPHEKWVEDIGKKNTYIEILEEITTGCNKVLCRCKVCNHEWSATPGSLKRGHGCPGCGGSMKKTTEEFIQDAVAVHGNKYDYSKVRYVNSHIKVTIVCTDHGDFCQSPTKHLGGRGCPKCTKSGFLSHDCGKLYIMVDDLELPTFMKIGVSVRVDNRKDEILKSAHTSGAGLHDLHILKTWSGSTKNMLSVEKSVHEIFNKYKINFPVKFNGSTEFFYYRPEVFSIVEAAYKEICGK